MQRAIGNEIRFRIPYRLRRDGPTSPKELRVALELPGNTLYHHLDTLVDVGLVENRKRNEPDSEGCTRTTGRQRWAKRCSTTASRSCCAANGHSLTPTSSYPSSAPCRTFTAIPVSKSAMP